MGECYGTWCLNCNSSPKPSCDDRHQVLRPEDVPGYLTRHARDGKLALLCGAGLSVFSPTNMPAGVPLKNFFLTLPGLKDASVAQELTLEQVISRVGWGVEFSLSEMFNGKKSKPNLWHHFIAHLMKKGLVTHIFTTNFDKMIENALGWRVHAEYLTVTNERYEAPDDEFSSGQKPTIWYLHGTYENMCITIPHIDDPHLAATRIRPLARFLESPGALLLSVGHSAQDRDIGQVLQGAKCLSRVVALSAAHGERPAFSKLDGCFAGISGLRVTTASYPDFIAGMWDRLELGERDRELESEAERPPMTLWTEPLQSWQKQLPACATPHIASRLRDGLQSLGSFSGATTIRLGKDEVRIMGEGVMINITAEAGETFRIFGDCTPDRGFLGWPIFNLRLRAVGYLGEKRALRAEQTLRAALCCPDEEEILGYIRAFIEDERAAEPYRSMSNYRSLVHKARALLTTHAFLHALTHVG